jgi:sugar phosphate permease
MERNFVAESRIGALKVRWKVFLFFAAFAMLSYVQRTSIGVAAQSIMPELHLSQMQIGWLNAAFATCYAFAQLPGGVLGQRFGGAHHLHRRRDRRLHRNDCKPLAPVLLAGTALFLALLAAQGLLGLSQGPVFPMVAAVSQAWFPAATVGDHERPDFARHDFGGAMTPVLIVVLTAHFGWQGALLWVAVPAVLLTATWARYARDYASRASARDDSRARRTRRQRHRQTRSNDLAAPAPDRCAARRAAADVLLLLHELRFFTCWARGRSCTS